MFNKTECINPGINFIQIFNTVYIFSYLVFPNNVLKAIFPILRHSSSGIKDSYDFIGQQSIKSF